MELVLKGVNQSKIAQKFHVTRRTIEVDVAALKKTLAKTSQGDNIWERIGVYNASQRLRIQRLWKTITSPGSDNNEVTQAVKALRQEEELAIKKDQIVGLLPKEASPLINLETNASEDGISNVQINIIQPKEDKKIKQVEK